MERTKKEPLVFVGWSHSLTEAVPEAEKVVVKMVTDFWSMARYHRVQSMLLRQGYEDHH